MSATRWGKRCERRLPEEEGRARLAAPVLASAGAAQLNRSHLLRCLLLGVKRTCPPFTASNRRNAPCRRRAFVHGARIVRFPPAGPAVEYRHRSAQSKFAFCIGPSDRTWRSSDVPTRQSIRGVNHSLEP